MVPLRIGNVNYLNALPFRYGLEHYPFSSPFELHSTTPANCARLLYNNKIDIGLIPIGSIPDFKNYHIVSNYCIGAINPVKTVGLFSNSKINNIKTIYLDNQSRTSILLAKLLAKEKWKINPEWKKGFLGFEKSIPENSAGIIIGDKTFLIKNKYSLFIDLAEEWIDLTQLPFVFACWISTKPIPDDLEEELNNAFKFGLSHISEAIKLYSNKQLLISEDEISHYLNYHIDYPLCQDKIKAINLFLSMVQKIE